MCVLYVFVPFAYKRLICGAELIATQDCFGISLGICNLVFATLESPFNSMYSHPERGN